MAIGLVGYHLGVIEAIALPPIGLLVLVIAAWRAARPEEGGNAGRPDISPWAAG